MSAYEAVLFDFDGVLIDSEPIHWECWNQILKRFGLKLDWETYSEHCIGVADRAMLEFLCARGDPPLDVTLLEPEYPRKKKMFTERMLLSPPISAEVISLIDSVRKEHQVGVVTSSGRSEVQPILKAAGILDKLDTVVYGGDVERLKPAPDPYLLALKRLGVKQALAVEDSKPGIASARAAGCDVVEVKIHCEMWGQVLERLR
ncbi:MAG: HAD family phosphatase [Bryobacteraceae bacterium]